MARAFGVRHLNAGLLEKLPLDVVGEEFAALCERAGPDLTVALEFMPYSGVPDLATAWRIVQGYPTPASSSTAGTGRGPDSRSPTSMTCLRSGSCRCSCADVRAEPMEPLRAESLGHRLPPGKGYGDTVGMVRGLTKRGVTPAVMAVEVISDELVARGVDIAAQVSADAAREVLASAATHRM